jgi:hypothetical protein
LTSKGIQCIPDPLYSPDLAACDFLFHTLKRQLQEQCFQTTDATVKAAEKILKMPKTVFNHVFDDWQKCWDKCIEIRRSSTLVMIQNKGGTFQKNHLLSSLTSLHI